MRFVWDEIHTNTCEHKSHDERDERRVNPGTNTLAKNISMKKKLKIVT